MESVSRQINLVTKLPYIDSILPFYGYAYESIRFLQQLCSESRNLWIRKQEAILRNLSKQTIHIGAQPINDNTINVLKKNDRYKMFKLDIQIDASDQGRLQTFCKMLKEMPDLEISRVSLKEGNNDLIATLTQKLNFDNEQDLFKIIEFSDISAPQQIEPYTFLSEILYPYNHDMSTFAKQAGSILIDKLEQDMNVDCVTNQIEIRSECVQKIRSFNLGTETFKNSVGTVIIDYFGSEKNPDVEKDIELVYEYFNNLNHVNLNYLSQLSLSEVVKLLKDYHINQVSFRGSSLKAGGEYSIHSKTGCVLLVDGIDTYFINFNNIKLESASSNYITNGDYLIFEYDHTGL